MSIRWTDCKNETFYSTLRHVPVDKDGDLCDSCEVSLLALSFSPKAVWKGVSLTLDY
jgi:hypothetical protein